MRRHHGPSIRSSTCDRPHSSLHHIVVSARIVAARPWRRKSKLTVSAVSAGHYRAAELFYSEAHARRGGLRRPGPRAARSQWAPIRPTNRALALYLASRHSPKIFADRFARRAESDRAIAMAHPRGRKSRARKRRFVEPHQADLGRPVLPQKIIHFSSISFGVFLCSSRLTKRGVSRSSRTWSAGCGGRDGVGRARGESQGESSS